MSTQRWTDLRVSGGRISLVIADGLFQAGYLVARRGGKFLSARTQELPSLVG
jgi:hypothetical protein